MECKKEKNKKKCPCPDKNCENNGLCCDCVAYHKAKKNLPFCLRPENLK